MSPEIYAQVVRMLCCAVAAMFLYQAWSSWQLSKISAKVKNAWHTAMCLATAVYCFVLVANTFEWPSLSGDLILSGGWVTGFAGYLCYLYAMERHLNANSRLLIPAKVAVYVLMGTHCVAVLFELLFQGDHFLLTPIDGRSRTLFETALHLERTTNVWGYASMAIGAFALVYGSIVFIQTKRIRNGKESVLKVGILVSLIAGANDTLLGAGLLASSLPVYYIANILEAARIFQRLTNSAYEELGRHQRDAVVARIEAVEGKRHMTLLRTITHDINNSLTILRVAVGSMQKSVSDELKLRKSLTRVDRACGHLESITASVLKDSRRQENAVDADCGTIDLRSLQSELEFLFEGRATEKNISLKFGAIPSGFSFIADHHIVLHQVMANILSNAIKFSPLGSIIKVSFSGNDERFEIQVRDSGPGISAEMIAQLKEQDPLLKSERGSAGEEGHGFGLGILKANVERFAGALEITVDNGTLVKVSFPIIELRGRVKRAG